MEYLTNLSEENKILLGLLCAGLMYLLILYILQIVKDKGKSKNIAAAKAEYDEVRNDQKKNREKLIDAIGEVYGFNYASMVRSGQLWQGMPVNLLLIAKGKASNIRQTVDTKAISQIWQYFSGDKYAVSQKPQLEVVIRNNEVISWEENQ